MRIYQQSDAKSALNELCDLNLVFIDPPWNTGKPQRSGMAFYRDSFDADEMSQMTHEICVETHGAIGNHGVFAIWIDYRTSHLWQTEALYCGFDQMGEVIIESGLGKPAIKSWPMKHSNILLFSLGTPYFNIEALPMVPRLAAKAGYEGDKRAASVLWSGYSNTDIRRTGYPTEKNPDICEIVVKAFVPNGGTYADVFCGSGSAAAFDIEDRTAYLSDISQVAVNTAELRFK